MYFEVIKKKNGIKKEFISKITKKTKKKRKKEFISHFIQICSDAPINMDHNYMINDTIETQILRFSSQKIQ